MSEGVWVIDPDAATVYVNPAMCAMLGYSEEEMIGVSFYKFQPEACRKDAAERLSERKPEASTERELVFIHKDGREIAAAVKTAPILSPDGEFRGVVSTVRDISEEKKKQHFTNRENRINQILSDLYIPLTDPKVIIFDIAKIILQHARDITGSKYGFVSELDESTGDNVAHTMSKMMASGYEMKENTREVRFPRGDDGKYPALWGHALNTGEAFYTNDPDSHPSSKGLPDGHIPVEKFLAVPVKLGDEIVGEIVLANPGRDYNDDDLYSIIRLGEFFGITIQRNRMFSDISDSELLLHQVFDNSPIRIYVKDSGGKIILANKALFENYGIEADEIIGKTILELSQLGLMKIEDAEQVEREERDLYSGKRKFLIYKECLTPRDGKVRWFRTQKSLFSYHDEICILGVSMDITQLREQEEELGRQLERYEDLQQVLENKDQKIYETYYQLNQIFNSSPVGMSLVDKEFNILMANETYCKLTNMDLKNVIQSKCYEVFRSESCFTKNCCLKLTQGGEKKLERQSLMERRDEQKIPCYVVSQPFFDFHGELIGVVHAYQDISQILKAQDDLKNKELQLYQSQKMEAIGRLAGGIAHDFNNLLTIIKGYTELLLLKSAGDKEMSEGLNEIFKASSSAASLTGQLLAFSRKQILDFKVLDLNHILKDMEKMLRRMVGENITVEIQLKSPMTSIRADSSQIEQVVMNLIVNAHDALPNGGSITISTRTELLENRTIPSVTHPVTGEYVILRIEDNGEGMSRETVDKVFEPFFTTKRPGEGTGLGLPTVFGIVKQHDGFIHVMSEVGTGSVFEIYFPAFNTILAGNAAPEKAEKKWTIRGKGETVLVVEDELPLSEFVRRVLEDNFYRVLTAGNLAEAKEIYLHKKSEISLVFTDLVLTDGFGMDYILFVRSIDPASKIIATSGYVDKQLDQNFFIDQGIPFIKKPYEVSLLLDTVHRILHGG